MELGTKYTNIEDVVSLLETHLGITFTKVEDGETGVSYDWSEEPNEFGASYYGIEILPTRIFDPEKNRVVLCQKNWKPYTFVVGVSEELKSHSAAIRELMKRGLLKATEIPLPPIT